MRSGRRSTRSDHRVSLSSRGADQEVRSDFQLISDTNRDLREQVAKGEFRGDLLARIDLWSFELPGLRDRPEDLALNLDFELERVERRVGRRSTMNKEARRAFFDFCQVARSRVDRKLS